MLTTGKKQYPAGWRRAGMLMHITSLPGADGGVGDLGASSRQFVDWLQAAGLRLWQVLPLHPPANDALSPYDAASAFAGNPLLIELAELAELELIRPEDTTLHPALPVDTANMHDHLVYTASWKLPLVREAAKRLVQRTFSDSLYEQYRSFCEREKDWLCDYVAFTMLRERYPCAPREQWPIADRVKNSQTKATDNDRISDVHRYTEAAVQFLFDRQLRSLRAYANDRDVWLMGDAPIYVSDDSADVWAHPTLFLLDKQHRAHVRTGAPADAMDANGQIWPMPAYNWTENARQDWSWWLSRLRREFEFADVVRIDHFRAFADWWSVPPNATSSDQGHWELGPGTTFFDAVKSHLGTLEMVVEDLGTQTEPLRLLRTSTGLPPMRVLVQGFDEGPLSEHLPQSWQGSEAAYTNTHDYNTIRGWADEAATHAKHDSGDQRLSHALKLTGAANIEDLPHASIELVMKSNARFALAPLQDWLGLGSDARMNIPGTAHGNWRWIAEHDAISDALLNQVSAITSNSNRSNHA